MKYTRNSLGLWEPLVVPIGYKNRDVGTIFKDGTRRRLTPNEEIDLKKCNLSLKEINKDRNEL